MSILALTSDTLIGTPATGNLEYNGQFFGSDSNASRAQLQRLVLSTSVASTSGTSINFNSIPAWIEKITVMFAGVSTNGTSNLQIQLGAGSVTTTGYISSASVVATAVATTTSTSGLLLEGGSSHSASETFSGSATITLLASNTWVMQSVLGRNAALTVFGGGSIALGGTLDRVRITTANGTDTFDAGSINILYEG